MSHSATHHTPVQKAQGTLTMEEEKQKRQWNQWQATFTDTGVAGPDSRLTYRKGESTVYWYEK